MLFDTYDVYAYFQQKHILFDIIFHVCMMWTPEQEI
jgi:hypothetical protein